MKPYLEVLPNADDASMVLLNRRLEEGIPFQWHHHPAYELTLTLNSRGQRYIGDHIGQYDDIDLVLVGPDLPHTWHSTGKVQQDQDHVALVIWFQPQWAAALCQLVVEFARITSLLAQARAGVTFSHAAACEARPVIEQLFGQQGEARLLTLLQLLSQLAADSQRQPLARHYPQPQREQALSRPLQQGRLQKVLAHLHQHYQQPVSIAGLAELAALSESGVQRLFRRHTGMTLSDYLIGLRIGEACALLAATDKPIAWVADQVGYRSLANFNRQFRALKAMTPRAFRQHYVQRAGLQPPV